MAARVASATETVEWERATIAAGTSSSELMRRAGSAAARVILSEFGENIGDSVADFAGPGNNGGDGWVVADELGASGIPVRVIEAGAPKTDESRSARDAALANTSVRVSDRPGAHRIVVDALLGTGSSGAPRDEIAAQIRAIGSARAGGARVVALDLPSGLDATTGEHSGSVTADLTISFGSVKRGQLIARDSCGTVVAVDIGLEGEAGARLPELIDADWVRARVPRIPGDAHKGTRKRLVIVGGARNMAGAAILAGEGALRSGIGILRIATAPGNENPVHASLPAALVTTWPRNAGDLADIIADADVIAIGPGLGKDKEVRDLVERVLLAWSGPVVLDADGLNAFSNDVPSLAKLLAVRPAVITPHPAELGRLLGVKTAEVLGERFVIGGDLAAELGASVVLKGTPTVVFSPSGARWVCAAGTPALATGGSGDVLTGITGTLLAQMCDSRRVESSAEAAACAAFVHGRAAERCGAVRGVTINDILDSMRHVWTFDAPPRGAGVIARLERLP
jgi:NAD(P)H-hydrate epimerase